MNLFQVDKRTCSRDGICAAVCPVRIISLEDGGYPTPGEGAEETCFRCGHCVAVCPLGCFTHRDIPVEQCPPIRKDFRLTAEDREHFLRNRRSTRVFQDKPVPRSEIAKLIDVARYAPSGCNSQCVEWLVLDNPEELRKLAGIIADSLRFARGKMPEEIARRFRIERLLNQWAENDNLEFLRDAPALIVTHALQENPLAASACTIALAYLELAAAGTGLGCCWAGWFHFTATNFPPMKEALRLPEGHACFGAMAVGYPKYRYSRLPTRKTPSVTWR